MTDVEAAADALRAKGLRLLYEQARHGTANSRVNFVHPKDAGGVLVELVEPAPSDRLGDGHPMGRTSACRASQGWFCIVTRR